MRRFCILLFFLCNVLVCVSQPYTDIIIDKEPISSISLKGRVLYFIDSTNTLDYKDVSSLKFDNNYFISDDALIFKDNEQYNCWYKFVLDNKNDKEQYLLLRVKNSLIPKMSIYSTFNPSSVNLGVFYPYSQRQIDDKYFLYKIHLRPQSKDTILIKVTGLSNMFCFPFTIMSYSEYSKVSKVSSFKAGVLYVLALLMFVFLIMLYMLDYKKQLLFLMLTFVFIILFSLWKNMVIFKYILPTSMMLNVYVGKFFVNSIMLFALLFNRERFPIIKQHKFLNLFYQVSKYYFLVMYVVTIIAPTVELHQQIFFLQALLLFFVFLSSFIVNKRHGNKCFDEYTGIIIVLIIYMFYLVYVFSWQVGVEYTGIIEMLLMLSAFVLIFYVFMIHFRLSHVQLNHLNNNLEKVVSDRTYQLISQQEEMKAQQEELLASREELKAQKSLLEQKNQDLNKLLFVVEKTNNLMSIFTADGYLEWFNKAFEFITKESYDDYVKSAPKSIFEYSKNKNIKHIFNACLTQKTTVTYETVYEAVDNDIQLWFHTTLTPIVNEKNEVEMLIAMDTDITKLKQYEELLNRQKQDAELQKQIAIQHKEELELHQEEITDSIRYAKRIQTAIMPTVRQINRDFPDSFVLFLPKDIVSGDFYWYHRIHNKYFVVAVDCTGHGVPGAFMSIIGNYLLNAIVIQNGVEDPAEILKHLNRKLKISLQADINSKNSDGMDISIAVVDKEHKNLQYAGALRPMFLFNKGEFVEVAGDKIPITSDVSNIVLSSFKTHNFNLEEGDSFYLFSDGIIDQFGGEFGKKFLTKRFKQLLFKIKDLPMKDQKEQIRQTLVDWQGARNQVDDILVMGLRL